MSRFRYAMAKFMAGRYGTDALNQAILVTALVLEFISMFTHWTLTMILAEVLLVLVIYRTFSRRIYQRQQENRFYEEKFLDVFRQANAVRKLNQKKDGYHYYMCPRCHQKVRVPRHRGRIEITCSRCDKHFIRHS